jgi:large subunit ribosomal protein L24
MNRIRKGDTVEIIAGDDLGARGEVIRVMPQDNRVVVSGINMVIKHQDPQRAGRSQVQGGRVQFEAPVDLSNVMLVCTNCNAASRVGFGEADGGKVRICRKCGEAID